MDDKKHIPLTEAVYYILLAVQQPMHGYAIMQYISKISHGRVKMGPGTLYGAIKTLLNKGWIELFQVKDESRKKEYVLTEDGLNVVLAEITRLEELINNGKVIMRGEENAD